MVGQEVAQTILSAVVDPFSDPDGASGGLGKLLLLLKLLRGQLILLNHLLRHLGEARGLAGIVRTSAFLLASAITSVHLYGLTRHVISRGRSLDLDNMGCMGARTATLTSNGRYLLR